MSAQLTPSQEDYLETIYGLVSKKGHARVRDIARNQNVSMASVNGALKRLARQNLVSYNRYDYVELTPSGKRRAARIADRHAILRRFLTEVLKVDTETAERDACAIEHHVSEETVKGLMGILEEK